MNIKAFTRNLGKYAEYYSSAKLYEKIKKVAKKLGVKAVYIVLLLYYATLDKRLSCISD